MRFAGVAIALVVAHAVAGVARAEEPAPGAAPPGDTSPAIDAAKDAAAHAARTVQAAGAPLPPQAGAVLAKIQGAEPKRNVFSVGLAGTRHSLKSGEADEVIGNAGAVSLGAGYIAKSWLFNASFDILLGPYEPTRQGAYNVDFYGTGATLWTGFSAQTLDLRSPAGGYGFALGLSYADMVGRSAEATGGSPEYTMRVNHLSLVPGLFFSWLEPARPRGNTPDLLKTRLEGEILSLGMSMPLLSTFNANAAKGRLRGYSIVLNITGVIGT